MKIGIYGGTFDPPHNGHVHACKSFLDAFDVDKLYIIPTSIPPHKIKGSNVGGKDRMEMSKLAFSGLSDRIELSDVELIRSGKSYTSDTLKHFKANGANEILLLCGTDMFVTLDTWHEFAYIFENATIVCIRRENEKHFKSLIDEKSVEYKQKYNASLEFIEADAIEMSSSDIRKKIADDDNVLSFIPKNVYDYILERGLYKNE